MTTSVGYASSSDGPVLDARADSIEIHLAWVIQKLQNIAVDQVLKISDPRGKVCN